MDFKKYQPTTKKSFKISQHASVITVIYFSCGFQDCVSVLSLILYIPICIDVWCYVNCLLLIIFTNSLDPDQAQQNVGPDLDPNGLTL